LADFPQADISAIDKALEQRMDYAQRISSLVLSIRKKEGLRVRQPLTKILLPVLDPSFISQVDAVKELILSEVNVKDVEYITDTEGFINKKAKANFKTLGKILGKHMKAGQAMIAEFDQKAISQLEKTNAYTLEIEGEKFVLTTEDIEVSFDEIPGWQVAVDKDITVALDISLTDALIAEGIARELVNRIQNIRKTSDFNVTDKITIAIEDHDIIRPAVAQFGEYIKAEVLGISIALGNADGGELVEITDDVSLKIKVEKV
jgi:isoleucyl-tRNA synthetase